MSTELILPQQEIRSLTEKLTPAQVKSDYNLVLQVMSACMERGMDFGVIPGTPKPSLWKPGAEKLGLVFRLAGKPAIEDLTTGDAIRYRVSTEIIHSPSGTVVAYGVGEASTDEEKYKWRKAIKEEWEETPEDRRRKKWGSKEGKTYSILQVRTNPADLANTILKMADKRSYISGILKATAASSIFSQDLEDMSEEMREAVAQAEQGTMPPIAEPKRKSAAVPDATPPVTAAQAASAGDAPPTAEVKPAPPTFRAMESKISGGSCTTCGDQLDKGEAIWFDTAARRAHCRRHYA